MSSRSDLHGLPGVQKEPDQETKGFFLQQTMLRIKEPKRSLDFYTRVLGMTLLTKLDFADMGFSLMFLGYEDPASIPDDPKERTAWAFSRSATLELTHNHGTEADDSVQYHNGNSDPKGFGHIGVGVPDFYAACQRFEELNVQFQKRPNDGKMNNIAFIKDPDGYWIEIFQADQVPQLIDNGMATS